MESVQVIEMGGRLVFGSYWRYFARRFKLKEEDILVFDIHISGLNVKIFDATSSAVVTCLCIGLDMKLEARGLARARQGSGRARPVSKVIQAKPKPSEQGSRLDKPAR